ncbi:glycosyltransferase [Parafrankia sp. FMc6]|uniref:glycosyltransferase n=1 Tax=Parafrankia soli TaxID=2599596 RepID=UPI0034D4E9F2
MRAPVDKCSLRVVTPYGPDGGSSRVRVFDWLRWLDLNADIHDYLGWRNADPAALVRQPGKVLRAELSLRTLPKTRAARLLLHREASPFSRGRLEQRLLSAAEFAIYDFDDALQWDVGGGWARRVAPKPRKCRFAVRSADRVIAGNDVLADWASAFSRDVVMIPSCVDPSSYSRKRVYDLNDPPLLVWVGSPSTEQYLRLVEQPLLEINRRTGARIRLVSSGTTSLGPLDAMVDREQWTRHGAGQLLTGCDVAIAPLADGLYERGKCAYKILEYAATGLPVVGSPIGANRLALHRTGGTAATRSDDWSEALLALLSTSAENRMRLGEKAYQGVAQNYSFSAWSSSWLSAVGLGDKSNKELVATEAY